MNTIESIRKENIGTLNELVEITRDGADFFGEAANQVANPQLKTIFVKMTDTKKQFADALSKELQTAAIKPTMPSSPVQKSWHQMYAEIRGKLTDKSLAFTGDVQTSEDRLLKAYDNVAHDQAVPTSVKNVVSTFLPTMHKQVELLRDRKWAVAA